MHILNYINDTTKKFVIDLGVGLIGFQVLGQLALTIDPKNTVEFGVGLIGILSLFGSGVMYFTTMTVTARFQRLIDRLQVQSGDMYMRLCDLERFSHTTHGYVIRQQFPVEFMPDQHTDF